METYTVAEYETQFADVVSGALVIDNDYNNLEQEYSNLTLNII